MTKSTTPKQISFVPLSDAACQGLYDQKLRIETKIERLEKNLEEARQSVASIERILEAHSDIL